MQSKAFNDETCVHKWADMCYYCVTCLIIELDGNITPISPLITPTLRESSLLAWVYYCVPCLITELNGNRTPNFSLITCLIIKLDGNISPIFPVITPTLREASSLAWVSSWWSWSQETWKWGCLKNTSVFMRVSYNGSNLIIRTRREFL